MNLYTTLIASGNVSINGFLYSTSQLTITPFEAVSEEELENAGQEALYLGTGALWKATENCMSVMRRPKKRSKAAMLLKTW